MTQSELSLLRKDANNQPSDAFDIEMDVVKLPSKGKLYSEDTPLANEEEIAIKPMGPIQENILASEALIKKGTVSSVLIKSCLRNQSIDVTELLLGDKAAILVALRISGFGHEYKANVRCTSCGEVFSHTFDLRKCPYKFLETNPSVPNSNLFEFVLPKSKKLIKFSLLTDKDDLEIMTDQRQKRKVLASKNPAAADIDTRPTDELLKMIKSIDGVDDRTEISKFVTTKMSMQDSRAFRQYINDISPGVDMEEEVKCTHCGEKDLYRVPLSSQFLWPKLSSK